MKIVKDPYRENEIIYRKRNSFKKILDFLKIENLQKTVLSVQKSQEGIYIFKSGDRADFLYNKNVVNNLSFNPLQIYNREIRNLYNLIQKNLEALCQEYEINKEKNMYFITSEYESIIEENFVYDTGGIRIPCFAGYYFTSCEKNSYIQIEKEKINIQEGSLILFEAGHNTVFTNVKECLSFNIAPLSMIQGQYPQKWMPI
jgi:hypothetical protein